MKIHHASLALLVLCFGSGCTDRIDEGTTREARLPAAVEPAGGGSLEWMGKRWPNGTIPYVIDQTGTLPIASACLEKGPLNAGQIGAIRASIAQLETLTPLRFEEQIDASQSFVVFRNATDGNSARVRGMPKDGSVNCVYINDDNANDKRGRRVVVHEILHSVGFDHEQQRLDREDFVEFNENCVTTTNNAKLFEINPDGLSLTPYDYESVMHYPSENFWDREAEGCEEPPLLKTAQHCTSIPDGGVDCTIDKVFDLSVHDINAVWRMYERPIGVNGAGEEFGSAFAAGDFDGDGYTDLAVGAPTDGVVFLYKGTAGKQEGLLGRLVAWRTLRPSDAGGLLPFFSRGRFGAALAAGDFDHDGETDLAVGAPGNDGNARGDGTVFIYRSGQPDPYSARRSLKFLRAINQAYLLQGNGSADDHFGAAIATGDFDADGKDDLAIGAPRKWIGSERSGAVYIELGKNPNHAVVLTPDKVWGGTNRSGARFGASLAAANLDPDDPSATHDLVVGSPEYATTQPRSGTVYVFQGKTDGTLVGRRILQPANATQPMRFGASVIVGNFNGQLTRSGKTMRLLAIGAPYRDHPSYARAGSVFLYAAQSVPFNYDQIRRVDRTTPATDQLFGDPLIKLPRGSGADSIAVGVPNDGAGKVVTFTALDASAVTISWTTINNPSQTSGDGFGTALAVANFLPMPGGTPGADELVVGAPTSASNGAAGSLWIQNSDQAEGSRFSRFDQETASPE